jgi:hypothetical protein
MTEDSAQSGSATGRDESETRSEQLTDRSEQSSDPTDDR